MMPNSPHLQTTTACEPLVSRSVDFAALLLGYSDSIYPFALLSTNGEVDCLFTVPNNDAMPTGMIEELEWIVSERRFGASGVNSVLVYLAHIESVDSQPQDVIAVRIIDHNGTELDRFYPYRKRGDKVTLGRPDAF